MLLATAAAVLLVAFLFIKKQTNKKHLFSLPAIVVVPKQLYCTLVRS